MVRKITVAVNERGLRIGQYHQHAKLTDQEVDRVRELHEDHGYDYAHIADWFEVSERCIAAICRYERRAQTPYRWKVVSKGPKNKTAPGNMRE